MTAIIPALAVWARASLWVLAAVLPFEMTATIGVGPLALSSVEVFLYAAVGLGALSLAGERFVAVRAGEHPALDWRSFARRHAGAAAVAAVLVLSAVAAPSHRGTALKFALRSLGGVALYLVAAERLRPPGAVLRTARGLAAGGVAAALLLIAEVALRGAPALLAPFHSRTFDVLGLPRASGPFQYPNIAAMYLEAALPVVLMLGATNRRGAVLSAVAAGLLGWAVFLTGSRAGVLTVVAVLAGCAITAGLRRAPPPGRAAAALAGLSLVVGGVAVARSPMTLRMQFWHDGQWYRSSVRAVGNLPTRLSPDVETRIDVEVTNDGVLPWPASGARPVDFSYHWLDAATGRTVVFNGVRTKLPYDVEPGGRARLTALVWAPPEPGRYRLHLDLVHELVTWFGDQGNPGLDVTVGVDGPTPPSAGNAAPLAFAVPAVAVGSGLRPLTSAPDDAAEPPVGRKLLWRAALAAFRRHPLLGLGPDNFRHAYGTYAGLDRPDPRLHANSWYFETLSTLGAGGVLAFALLAGTLAAAGRRARRRLDPGSPDGRLALGVAAGLLAFALHGVFDYFLEFTPTYALGWLLAGMLVALGAGPPAPSAAPAERRTA